ncbi:MAG: response regulator [Candidatus Moranbacteria bacterium]|nr:response regulator [Candidatus Moranbacteria bacterium]
MHILIVEDENKILNYLKSSLKAEMFSVDSTNNGTDGLFLARTNHYDLIVLDKNLPKMSGDQVCKEIRRKGINTPIIFLTGEDTLEDKLTSFNIGADDYLTKPYSFDELLARIKALLRRPRGIEKNKIKIGDLLIDRNKFKVTRNNKDLRLTRKEFNLLLCLASSRGNVVSRGKILETVWDMHADPFSNTIESHILSLRKKVDPKKKLIKTIPGRGYMIEAA